MVNRTLELILVILMGSVLIWSLILAIPGGPAGYLLGEEASPAELAALEEELGLDRSRVVQYIDWISSAATGDLGVSYVSQTPVTERIAGRIAPTLQLALFGLLIGVGIAVPAAVLASWKPRTFGAAVEAMFTFALAVPAFWIGIILILVFAVQLGWLPAASTYIQVWEDPTAALQNLLLPGVSLGVFSAGLFGRFIRASLVESASSDYYTAGRARGLSPLSVIVRHGLRNALLPFITVLGLRAGALLSGSIVIEAVFNYPGLGRLLIHAVTTRDYHLLQGILLVVLIVFVITSVVADLLYRVADPRVRRAATRPV